MSKRPSTKLSSNSSQRRVPKKLYTILGPPAVSIQQEDTFDELWQMFRDSLMPANFIEEMMIRNIADLEMEVRIVRRLKAALMSSSRDSGLQTLLGKLGVDAIKRRQLTEAWMRGDTVSLKEVEALLKQGEMDTDMIFAQTLANRIDVFEKIDRMIATAEIRKTSHIDSLVKYKTSWAAPIKAITEVPIDVEFRPATGEENDKYHSS